MKAKKKYFKTIKKAFQYKGKKEKEYLLSLKRSIEESDADNFQDLTQVFGTPEEIISSYYESVDGSELLKKITYKKYGKYMLLIVLIVAFIFVGMIYNRYQENKKFQIDNIEVKIEES